MTNSLSMEFEMVQTIIEQYVNPIIVSPPQRKLRLSKRISRYTCIEDVCNDLIEQQQQDDDSLVSDFLQYLIRIICVTIQEWPTQQPFNFIMDIIIVRMVNEYRPTHSDTVDYFKRLLHKTNHLEYLDRIQTVQKKSLHPSKKQQSHIETILFPTTKVVEEEEFTTMMNEDENTITSMDTSIAVTTLEETDNDDDDDYVPGNGSPSRKRTTGNSHMEKPIDNREQKRRKLYKNDDDSREERDYTMSLRSRKRKTPQSDSKVSFRKKRHLPQKIPPSTMITPEKNMNESHLPQASRITKNKNKNERQASNKSSEMVTPVKKTKKSRTNNSPRAQVSNHGGTHHANKHKILPPCYYNKDTKCITDSISRGRTHFILLHIIKRIIAPSTPGCQVWEKTFMNEHQVFYDITAMYEDLLSSNNFMAKRLNQHKLRRLSQRQFRDVMYCRNDAVGMFYQTFIPILNQQTKSMLKRETETDFIKKPDFDILLCRAAMKEYLIKTENSSSTMDELVTNIHRACDLIEENLKKIPLNKEEQGQKMICTQNESISFAPINNSSSVRIILFIIAFVILQFGGFYMLLQKIEEAKAPL